MSIFNEGDFLAHWTNRRDNFGTLGGERCRKPRFTSKEIVASRLHSMIAQQ